MSFIKQNNINNQLFKKRTSLLLFHKQQQQQQLQRRMATIQANTDVRSAAYHFKQQKHMPYFLEYLMWVVFGSESLHLIWLKSEYNDYKDHVQYKIKLLTELIHLLETNAPVPESLRNEICLLKLDEKHKQLYQDDVEDDYLDKLIASAEAAENTTKENMTTVDTILPTDNTSAIPVGSDQSSIIDNKNKNNNNNNTTPDKKQKFII
ncbi:unnamed protein product [Cunninghamella echinulata]